MSQKNKGILLIICSAFCFALMNMMVRFAGDLPSIEKSFFRNFVAVFFAFIALKRSHTPIRVPKGALKPLLLRSIFGTMGILCNYYAIDHLMLADASILNKLSPFFAILFSFIEGKGTPIRGGLRHNGVHRQFVYHQTGYGDVYHIAAGFHRTFGRAGRRYRLHLCADSRNSRRKGAVYRPLFFSLFLPGNTAISDF